MEFSVEPIWGCSGFASVILSTLGELTLFPKLPKRTVACLKQHFYFKRRFMESLFGVTKVRSITD
jgi:predicted cobalt transporter CbtA